MIFCLRVLPVCQPISSLAARPSNLKPTLPLSNPAGSSNSSFAAGLGSRQTSGGSGGGGGGGGGARQPDHYDLPVRPAQGGAATGLGAPARSAVSE